MIETERQENETARGEGHDAREPRGPVAHQEVDIGDPPDATTNGGEESTQSGGSGGCS